MTNIIQRLKATPLVFDGAMGTMIYAKGVFINTCYDELCLTRPDLILEIHKEYVQAGADIVESNTFGANRVKLRHHGLADRVAEINSRGVALAREAAGDDVYVGGSVGPCLSLKQAWRESGSEEIREAFREQIGALADAGADLVMLETFVHPEELALAAEVARASGKPVMASFSTGRYGETALGGNAEAMVSALEANDNVDVVGINCGVGPALAYEAAEKLLPRTSKPFVVMPNAGMPRDVDGRMIYLTSAEYFTEYAKRFIELGVRGIGGCCGTTPEHIRVAARSVKTLSTVKRHVEVRAFAPKDVEVDSVPLAEKSSFARLLSEGKPVTSVELLPPRSCDLSKMIAKAELCREHGVDAINIPDGPRASSRVSPMVASIVLQRDVGIEPVLHYCCRDRNLIGMQADLLGADVAGVRNILIITGDPPKLGDYPDATGVFDVDAIGLTQVATNLNHGRDVGGNPVNPPTGICIGVGANPCAVSMELEITRYFAKIDAGAEFAITQPIFDPDALFRFLDRVETYERTIPVLAGVWPLVSYKNAEFMRNEVPGVEIPDEIMERMNVCETKEDGIRTGIELAREICARIEQRVAGFQVSAPFGRAEIALKALGRM